MKHQKISPADGSAQLLALAGGLWVSRALWVAAKLRISDHINKVPVSVSELAGASDTQPDALRRVLVALASIGVFKIGNGGCFAHTPLSELLRSDHPASQRAFVESVFGHEHYAAWGAIEGAVRTGTPGFDLHYGKPSFDWFADNPDAAILFGEAMTGATRAMEDAVLAAHDFGDFALGVDVGGSHSSLIRRLLAKTPLAEGVVFDLPGTIEDSRRGQTGSDLEDRLASVGGNFFKSVPAGGDLYLLKFIMHDWSDHKSVAILSNVRAAMRPDGAVAIIEMVLPDDLSQAHPGRFVDLNMLSITGGRERSADGYAVLLRAAGLKTESITPTASPVSIIIARPAEYLRRS